MNSVKSPVVVGIADKQPTALRFALREALRSGAEMRVVHAASIPVQPVYPYLGPAELEGIEAAGQKVLDDAREFLDQEVALPPVSFVLSIASAVEALEEATSSAQLLVIGADDIPWYDRMLGGGVARHMARHAPCPVVVVPEVAYPAKPTGGVVLTLDGDSSATGPLVYAFEQASARGRELHILHATPPATLAADAEAIRANIAEVLAGWSQTYPDVRVIRAFIVDGAEEAITAASTHAELVVVGRSHSRNVSFALTRPLAMQVLRRAGCPIAIVPSDYRGSLTCRPVGHSSLQPPAAMAAPARSPIVSPKPSAKRLPRTGMSCGRTSATCGRSTAQTPSSSAARSTSATGCTPRREPSRT